MTFEDIGGAAGEALAAAGCQCDLDAWRLLEWRAIRLTHAMKHLETTGPGGRVDPLVRSVTLTAAALAGMLSAVATMRDPHRPDGETTAAARGLRGAVRALQQAADDAGRNATLAADLLDLTD
jgi:hypothetical protein